jgi:hypothetical protein
LHSYTSQTTDGAMRHFLKLLRQSQISKKGSQSFLSFINSILPIPNRMPRNMNNLLKEMHVVDYFKKRTVCTLCGGSLRQNETKCNDCPGAESQHVALILDTHLPSLLSTFLSRLAPDIERYRKTFSNAHGNMSFDIPFAQNYRRLLRRYAGQNLLSLILHIDGISLVKSSKLCLWVCNASIVELPPNVRTRRSSILLVSMYIGYSEPNAKLWLDACFVELNTLKQKGLGRREWEQSISKESSSF